MGHGERGYDLPLLQFFVGKDGKPYVDGYRDTTLKVDVKQRGWNSYRKKPVVVRALKMSDPFEVQTLEGLMHGKKGDFLIQGIKGELYPCDKKIFKESYEAAEK